MPIKKNNKKRRFGQVTLEFTTLCIIVIGALIVIQHYFKRGVQGRWKTAVDELSDELYDPYTTDSDVTFRTAANSVVEVSTMKDSTGFWTMRKDQTNSLDTRSGMKKLGDFN